jgi:tRNA(fMet)-specific endonuclease VapC
MEVICVDTDILIAYNRAKQKNKTKLFELASQGYGFAVTTVTIYEVLRGDDSEEDIFWEDFFDKVRILDFDFDAALIAGNIYRELKKKGNLIETDDLLIGSIAVRNKIKLATDNKRHLNRIPGLVLI